MRIGRIQNNYSAAGFDMVRESGLSFIEICVNYDEDAKKLIAARESVKAEIERTGIDVSAVGRWNHDLMANGTIDPEKLALYEELLETAVYLGAKTFICGCNYDESISLFQNYKNAITFFETLLRRADGRIKVAVENCHWNNYICTPKEWEVVLGELPELTLKFDASHTYNRGDDYLAELSDWCHRVSHVHLKGVVRAGSRKVDDPPAGMDDLNWPAIFAILYSRGYNGDLSIEPHSAAWKGERGAAGIAFTAKFVSQFLV